MNKDDLQREIYEGRLEARCDRNSEQTMTRTVATPSTPADDQPEDHDQRAHQQ